jgi:hypothetical protein
VFVSIAGVANLVPYKRYRELRDPFSSAATYCAGAGLEFWRTERT